LEMIPFVALVTLDHVGLVGSLADTVHCLLGTDGKHMSHHSFLSINMARRKFS